MDTKESVFPQRFGGDSCEFGYETEFCIAVRAAGIFTAAVCSAVVWQRGGKRPGNGGLDGPVVGIPSGGNCGDGAVADCRQCSIESDSQRARNQ